MEDKEITIFGEGKMVRAFSFVEDVVDVLVHSLEDKFEDQTMNLGASYESTIQELLEKIEKVSGKKAKVKLLPARPQEIMTFIARRGILTRLYDYKETPLEIGLKKTWDSINLPDIIKEENEIV